MVFSSIVFLLYFLPVFLLLYQFTGKKYKNILILVASIFFYSWGAPKFVFVIIASTIIDFFIVKNLHKSQEDRRRKLFLGLSIFMNLGLLAYFKYANFFVENINELLLAFGIKAMKWTEVLLPIGISFYTFQTLTYSIDVYRRATVPLEKLTDYLLYIMSFPQMIAGPIVRFNAIATEIVDRKYVLEDRLIGFYRFSIGLAKKVLIANVMAEQADLILDNGFENISTATAWLGIMAYTFQIYFDFSGYSDMAIGLGRMMGFHFPENFDSPYTSKSISEFWRRWHMTLGSFMKDYLYIPLGGNRTKTKFRLYFNLWIVFLLSGLWHGAAWNFVIWGAYHGFFLILDRLFLLKFLKFIGKIPATIITFFLVVMGWAIFRIQNIHQLGIFFRKLFEFNGTTDFYMVPGFFPFSIIAALFSWIIFTKKGRKLADFMFFKNNYSLKQNIYLTIMAVFLFYISVFSITSSDFNPFIYFRF